MLVYGKYECFVMQMLYVCVLCASCGSSQCCVLHDLQFVNTGRGCKRGPYGRGIFHSRSDDCLVVAMSFSFCCHRYCSVVYLRSRLLLYAGSGVNRVQVVLSGCSARLFCSVQTKTLCRYGCMYFMTALVIVCVDGMVMSSA